MLMDRGYFLSYLFFITKVSWEITHLGFHSEHDSSFQMSLMITGCLQNVLTNIKFSHLTKELNYTCMCS